MLLPVAERAICHSMKEAAELRAISNKLAEKEATRYTEQDIGNQWWAPPESSRTISPTNPLASPKSIKVLSR
jgi:hypothetical protein